MNLIHKTQGIFLVASGTVGFPRRTLFSEVRYSTREEIMRMKLNA
jgi:hypothetical protein